MANSLITPASRGGEDFQPIPAGQYVAKCVGMVDIGTQTVTSKQFGTSQKRQIILSFEIVSDIAGNTVRREDGQHFSINQTFTWSLHQNAALRAFLDSWRGRPFTDAEAQGFDIAKLKGQGALLQIVHNPSGDRTYANIGSIMSWAKPVQGENEEFLFSIADAGDIQNVFPKLPQWMQEKIRQAPEWAQAGGQQTLADVGEQVFGVQAEPDINISDVQF